MIVGYIKSMMLRELLWIMAVVLASAQEMVDYSHTAAIQKTQMEAGKQYELAITAAEVEAQALDFPAACARHKALQSSELEERDRPSLSNQEELLGNLKSNMTQLLKLAEQIRLARSYVAEYSEEKSTQVHAPLEAYQLAELRTIEEQLLQVNASIEAKVKALSVLILEEINRTKDGGFSELRLGFELTALEARLRFLEDFRRNGGKTAPGSSIQDYFRQIGFQLGNEDRQAGKLGELLQRFAENSALQLKITNQEKKLQAKNHIICNKEECRLKNIRPINRENQQHIADITNKLRHLKKVEDRRSAHCEGVARKLELQIRKVLRAYNYSHVCAEGLDQLRQERTLIEEKLRGLKDDYARLAYDSTFKRIQLFFNQTRADREELANKAQKFDLDQYILDPSLLDQDIAKLKEKLKDIRYRIEHPPEGDARPFDHQAVRERVREINQEQHSYCKLKDQYQLKYRTAEKQVRSFQFKIGQAVAINRQHARALDKLASLQSEFHQLRTALLQAIE